MVIFAKGDMQPQTKPEAVPDESVTKKVHR